MQGFSRYHKYAIGSDLRDTSRGVLKLIVRANARPRTSATLLLRIREEVEQLKVLLRLAMTCTPLQTSIPSSTRKRLVVEIAKQNEGWLKSQHRPSHGQNRKAMPAS